ncbi:solute carrier organic anion transporter family member 2B1-like [Mercenaria mercenaria]|uniref:solute carrier organic anion transporter family member 2B1-like n=1 Tax=Mercenaria mercenaria TaxID=6596 RepID=UPI00234E8658|nr:solute carrier organic anion transporter family member 2B1-like [Mercenaria mercenaria]XP_053376209.1 solute carrier organic anion transporter family member 2B1-like [Mercenaria mercenaria]
MAPNGKTEESVAFPVNGDAKHVHHRHHEGLPEDMLCGIGPFKFQFLQRCARMGSFVGAYSICGLMTSILSMYIVSQITTIEKQYGLSSSQSGFLLSCNDIGFLVTTLFASYFARKLHIPRTLWFCVILYGVAGIVCSLPYFVSKDFVFEQSAQLSKTVPKRGSNSSWLSFSMSKKSPMCKMEMDTSAGTGYAVIVSNTSKCDIQGAETSFGVGEPNEYTKVAMTFIAIGMIIQGLAKAPRYPFITTYVDDNVKKKNTAMYMGIISGIGIFGPAIAFGVGGVFSRQYVTLEDVPISPRHPAWIGAWWLGFIVFGVLAIFLSFPLLCYPKRMRSRKIEHKQPKAGSLKQSILGFFKSIFRLVCNPVYMLLVVSNCVALFAVAGMLAFSAKYLETQFFIPAWKANMLLGVMNIVAASAGTVIGGFIVTKRKLSPLSCVKMLLLVGCLALVQNCLGYVFGCGNADISGFNVPSQTVDGTNATCSAICGCDAHTFFPVCASNNQNYMSPCHAGCQYQDKVMFEDCACAGQNATAMPGLCETSCVMLYPYLVNNIFGAFLATLGMMPGFIVMLRSVSELDKSLAVGFTSLLSTICGWFAGPVVFGSIVDTACIIWSASCSGQGACALYDNVDLRIKKHTFEIVPKVITILLQLLVFLKARRKMDWSVDKPEADEEMDAEKSMMAEQEEMNTFPKDWKPEPIFKGVKESG